MIVSEQPKNWVDNGYGVPRMVHAIYIVKLVFFYVLGGIVVATVTSGLPAFWHVAQWWNEPIVYQKVILGPAGRQDQPDDGRQYWGRPGTIRLRPWRRVPFTAGNRRTWFDVSVYLALIVSVIVPLVLPGVPSDSLSAALPQNTSGLVNPVLLIAPMVLLVLIGHTFRPLHYPMTSAIGLGIVTAGHRFGWPVAAGGSQSITNVLAGALGDLGGKIETGVRIETASQLAPAFARHGCRARWQRSRRSPHRGARCPPRARRDWSRARHRSRRSRP